MHKRTSAGLAPIILALAIPVHAQEVDAAARAAILKAQEAQSKQRAYSVAATSQAREALSWRLVYVAPDRYHYRETTDPPRQDEIILIAGEGWMKETRKKLWEPAMFDFSRMMREEFRSPPAIDAEGHRATSIKALPPADVNGVTTAVYEYVVEKDKDTWRVTMWVAGSLALPVRYRAEHDDDGDRTTYTWDIVHDASLKVDSPAAQVACKAGAECLDFGERVRLQGNLSRAAEFYDQACRANSWQGCLGYASHLVGLITAEATSAADKTKLSSQAISLLDGVIKARPTVWRALFYKGIVLRSTSTKEGVIEGIALTTRALALAKKATGADAEWDKVLWPANAAKP